MSKLIGFQVEMCHGSRAIGWFAYYRGTPEETDIAQAVTLIQLAHEMSTKQSGVDEPGMTSCPDLDVLDAVEESSVLSDHMGLKRYFIGYAV